MRKKSSFSRLLRVNFYVDAFNFIPLLATTVTGIVLQLQYHAHKLSDGSLVLGFDKQDWIIVHKWSAVLLTMGVVVHCALHGKSTIAAVKSILRFEFWPSSSMCALLISVPVFLTATISWIFFNPDDLARFALLEIHDKLALLLVFFFGAHIYKHAGWMIRIFR